MITPSAPFFAPPNRSPKISSGTTTYFRFVLKKKIKNLFAFIMKKKGGEETLIQRELSAGCIISVFKICYTSNSL